MKDELSENSKLLMPTHLRTNLLSFAYNVDTQPSFSWWNHSQQNGATQVAYQIVVSKRLHEIANKQYILDTDWVDSSKNAAIQLSNLSPLLKQDELYYWQVRVKDNFGNTSDYSQPSKFMTEKKLLPTEGIWAGDVGQSGELPHLKNVVFFKSPQFDLNTVNVDTAVVTAFSRGNESVFAQGFDLYMNGSSVGVGSARPQTNYLGQNQTAVYYNSYDVTAFILQGNNSLAALATGARGEQLDTLKKGSSTIDIGSEGTLGNRAFWCQLDVYTTSGERKTVLVSNADWKALDGSSAFGDYGAKIRSIYFEMVPENVDLRYYPQNWADTDFDDQSWPNAIKSGRVMIADNEVLLPYRSENSQRVLTDEPQKSLQRIGDGYILDLGKEIIGSLSVDISSNFNQRLDIFCGEQLDEAGHVRHHLAAGPDYVESWTLVKGENKFTTLQMKNFRYIEIKGFKGNLSADDIKGWAIQQPFDDEESDFDSSNDLLNREYELSKYTIKATNQDIFVDSQARERRPYEGDLLVNGLTSFAVSSHYSLNRHTLDYLIDNPTWPEDYKLFNIEMAWQDYLYTGDQTLLQNRYEDLKVKLNRGIGEDSFDGAKSDFTGNLKNGHGIDNFDDKVGLVTNNGLVDWPIPERDGFVEGEYNTPFNAVTYGGYLTMRNIAEVTGHKQDVPYFENRAKRIKSAMIDKLYDKNNGIFYDSMNKNMTINKHASHHSSAYALCYGIYDDQKMADMLAEFVGNDGRFIGSVYFIYFMLKGLVDSGHADKAIELLTNSDNSKDANTFAAILDTLGATIAPEAWSNKAKKNLTMSHPWGATPGLTLIQGVMGIIPLEPGFSKFRIRVRPGNLEKLSVKTPSTKGIISVNYIGHKSKNVKTIKLTIPMNSTAQLELPLHSQNVTVEGADTVEIHDGTLSLKSGSYVVEYN